MPGILTAPHVPSAHAGTPTGAPTATSDDLTSHSAGVTTATRFYAECRLLAASCNTAAIMRHMGKGKLVTAHGIKVYGGAEIQFHSFLNLTQDGPGGQLHTCGHFTQEKKPLVPTKREVGGLQHQSRNSGEEENILSPPGNQSMISRLSSPWLSR